jgi:hypothetical protein
MVGVVLGALRLMLAAFLVVTTVVPVTLIALLPWRFRGAKWSHWVRHMGCSVAECDLWRPFSLHRPGAYSCATWLALRQP